MPVPQSLVNGATVIWDAARVPERHHPGIPRRWFVARGRGPCGLWGAACWRAAVVLVDFLRLRDVARMGDFMNKSESRVYASITILSLIFYRPRRLQFDYESQPLLFSVASRLNSPTDLQVLPLRWSSTQRRNSPFFSNKEGKCFGAGVWGFRRDFVSITHLVNLRFGNSLVVGVFATRFWVVAAIVGQAWRGCGCPPFLLPWWSG